MELLRDAKPIYVRLRKDLTRSIKRGHAWLYSDAVEIVPADSGAVAILTDRKGEPIASGIYDPNHPIPFRVCRTTQPLRLDDEWLIEQLSRAIELRKAVLDQNSTTGYRLIAGEGDGLPGLIIDVYDHVAVIKLDGGAPEAFYRPRGIASWLSQTLQLDCVVLRSRERGRAGEAILGNPPIAPIPFLENGLLFTADVLQGQKTGFFLDQRDNRALVQGLSHNKSVLNLFSFNGGFSIAAGRGGACAVTSVDIAAPAIEAASMHWELNGLPPNHSGHAEDCFEFLERAILAKQHWDIVICDPPSFAPNEKSRDRALAAYAKLAELSARTTQRNGILALASCSSHVDGMAFTRANYEGIARARRRATVLNERGLPPDHPTPLAMPELRYLKFQLFRVD